LLLTELIKSVLWHLLNYNKSIFFQSSWWALCK